MKPELKKFLVETGYLVPVQDFPGYYVTRFGQIYGDKMHRWIKTWNKGGYIRVGFRKNNQRYDLAVHRLVARAFVPGYFDGAVVNHINGIKNDNNPKNLEWTTQKRNAQLAINKSLIVTTASGLELHYENCKSLCGDLWECWKPEYGTSNLTKYIRAKGGLPKYGLKVRYADKSEQKAESM